MCVLLTAEVLQETGSVWEHTNPVVTSSWDEVREAGGGGGGDEARHRDRLSCMEKGQVSESHSHPAHSPALSRTSSKSLDWLGGSRWSYWGLD